MPSRQTSPTQHRVLPHLLPFFLPSSVRRIVGLIFPWEEAEPPRVSSRPLHDRPHFGQANYVGGPIARASQAPQAICHMRYAPTSFSARQCAGARDAPSCVPSARG